MARATQNMTSLETCEKCESFLEAGQEVCSTCGKPTKYMSFKTRAQYEVEQWRRYKSDVPAAN